jgi:polar amino acid transport system substrate-binding protein
MMKTTNFLTMTAAVGLVLSVSACGGSAGAEAQPTGQCTSQVSDTALVKPKTLTYATNATLPPMQYMKDGEVAGMRIELAEKVAANLCLTPEAVNIPFDAQIPGLSGKRWDMINTGMFYTEKRAQTVGLVPYEVQAVSISVQAGNPESITGQDDLSGKAIAVEAPGYEFDTLNLINENFKAAGKEPIEIKTFPTNADAFQALSSGQVDGATIVESVTSYYQNDGRFETAFGGLREAPLAFGFAKENTELANAVAAEMTELKESGWLTELFAKYNVTGYSGAIELSTGPLKTD